MASLTQWTWVWVNFMSLLVMNREAWCAEVHGVTKCRTWLSDWTYMYWLKSRRGNRTDTQIIIIPHTYRSGCQNKSFWGSGKEMLSNGGKWVIFYQDLQEFWPVEMEWGSARYQKVGGKVWVGAEDSEGSGAGEEGKTIAHSRGLAGGQGGELRSSQVDWESAELRRDHLQGVWWVLDPAAVCSLVA